ncbi:VC0807 family protein [Streptomyces sp. NPDC047869]|uniref:VC0807 family protein n=1 Tax=Streptomyces sp. NPDC047869 TaxID=3154709 RepID=UPI003452664C
MTKTTGNQDRTENQSREQSPSRLRTFKPLLVDVALPIGAYYLLKEAFGMSTFGALAWSSVVPAVRTVWGVVKERTTNALALLTLVVNVVSLVAGFVSGDPRLMLAKDGAVSSTLAIGILVSVALGKPAMTAGMKPFLIKGDAGREAAWQRLASGAAAGSVAFRRRERTFSLVWGTALLLECVARVVGAYTVPVDTMVWLGTVIIAVVLTVAFVVGGGLAAEPMARLLAAEAKAEAEAEADMAGRRPEMTVAA